MKNAVVIQEAPKVNYMHNYVCLPYYYGTERYFSRPDVRAIRQSVYESLEKLDQHTGVKDKFRGQKVYIKPNLVMMQYKAGFALDQIPQTTDPRVFEAVVSWLKELGCDITIMESSGKGAPTRMAFKTAGYDRIARQYGTGLVALDEQPIDHYYAPKALVQRDVYVPRQISDIIEGRALYVSVPKMKTNTYTGVTLGFKNAMGVLPGYMRYRNHGHQIEAKLVDLLYLFQPDLTVIDGIIGGEGMTPGPVDPVKVGMIVTGTNSVEVDRVATRIMGFDPDSLTLMQEAAKRGFGDPEVTVIGEERVVPFRPADRSFLSERFHRNWPNVKYFVGHTNDRAPRITDIHSVTPEQVYAIEDACRGGCLATMAYNIESLNKAKKRPSPESMRFGMVLGNGCEVDGKRYWFDRDGKPYDVEALKEEAKTLKHMMGVGACTAPAYEACDICGGGCCNVSELLNMFMLGTGHLFPLLGPGNEYLPDLVAGMVGKWLARRKVVKGGERFDIPYDAIDDRIFPIGELSEEELQKDWIKVPMPKLTPEEIKQVLRKECTVLE